MILEILQHALGRDQFGQIRTHGRIVSREEYRNHFCTGPGSKDWDACVVACAQGLMRCRPDPFCGGDFVFHVTEAGRAYVLANSPKPPVKTRRKP